MRKRFIVHALLFGLAPNSALLGQQPSLAIQVDRPAAKLSPMLYGLMTEEINFSYDGGLCPELVRDRAIGPGRRPAFHWTMATWGNSVVDVSADQTTGPSTALPRSLKVSVAVAPVEHRIQIPGPRFEHSFVPYSINVLEVSY
jgi:alpha-N-arabinofuranosidase